MYLSIYLLTYPVSKAELITGSYIWSLPIASGPTDIGPPNMTPAWQTETLDENIFLS